ncbi:MAG: ABC transporter substrate-binding protein [Dehalococcoidia bacterium]|nr:ABC transporter substrate-binding protein [Dehalococcoidia bacterium]
MSRKNSWMMPLILVVMVLLMACAPAATPAPTATKPPAAPKATSPAGGGQEPTKAAPAPTQASAKPAGDPIKVAFLAHLSFPPFAAMMKTCQDAGDLEVANLNAKGGVLGRPVSMVTEPISDKGEEAAAAMEKLISRDKVVAVIGPELMNTLLAAVPVAEKYQVATFGAMQADARETEQGYKSHFAISSRAPDRAQAFVDFMVGALKPKPERVAILTENSDYGASEHPFLDKAAKAAGLNVVASEEYSAFGTVDYKSLLTKVKGTNPDVVLMIGFIGDAIQLMKQSKEVGLDAKLFIGQSGWDQADFLKGAADAANYAVAQVPFFRDAKWAGAKEFDQQYLAKYGFHPYYECVQVAGSVDIVVDAIKRANSADPVKVRDAIKSTDMNSMIGPVKFDAKGQNLQNFLFVQAQNGDHKLVWPAAQASTSLVYPVPPLSKR